MQSNTIPAPPRKLEPSEQQRQQILDTFIRLVKVDGLRAVSMLSLCKKLGISTKTVYRHFATKSDLIHAILELNENRFYESRTQRIMAGQNLHQRIVSGSLEWLELRDGLGDWFWRELERDYADIHALYDGKLQLFLEASKALLRPEIRDGLNQDFAMSILWKAINDVPAHEECNRLGMTRKEALVQSIDIWARGSLKMYA